MTTKPRLLRITTVPISLKILLNGQLTFFAEQGFEVLAVSSSGKEADDLVRRGIAHRVVDMTRKITPLRDLIALFRLISLIREFKPDIVHTHTPKAGLLGMLAARICGVKVRMHTVAGLPLMEYHGLTKKILILAERLTYKCATAVFPNSWGLRSYIEMYISQARNIRVIGKGSTNGIDSDFFSASTELDIRATEIRRSYSVQTQDVVFSFVGRIVKSKGICELIDAFKTTLKHQPANVKYHLLLIGSFEQDLDPIPQEAYKFLHEHPQVILAGFQSDVRPWLRASDIFVFPSYREGFPNVVMQACCLEVPAIVSNINGCNEIITHGETGLVVTPKESQPLAEAMKHLANDDDLRREFALKARNKVVSDFDQKYVWHQLLAEYQRSLTGQSMGKVSVSQ